MKPPRYYSLDMTCLVRNLMATAEYQEEGGRRKTLNGASMVPILVLTRGSSKPRYVAE